MTRERVECGGAGEGDIRGVLPALQDYMRERGSVLVALSGGVDSAVLAAIAHDVLGERTVAATTVSPTHPARDLEDAHRIVHAVGIRHRIMHTDELAIPGFAENGPRRCYLCRRSLAHKLWDVARNEGLSHVLEGSNLTEIENEERPGVTALHESGIESPFIELRISKEEIRAMARGYGLPVADKPSSACLASRFPHGESITADSLRLVERAEGIVSKGLRARQVRVRVTGDSARIELDRNALGYTRTPEGKDAWTETVKKLKPLGFVHADLDPRGYRPGGADDG